MPPEWVRLLKESKRLSVFVGNFYTESKYPPIFVGNFYTESKCPPVFVGNFYYLVKTQIKSRQRF